MQNEREVITKTGQDVCIYTAPLVENLQLVANLEESLRDAITSCNNCHFYLVYSNGTRKKITKKSILAYIYAIENRYNDALIALINGSKISNIFVCNMLDFAIDKQKDIELSIDDKIYNITYFQDCSYVHIIENDIKTKTFLRYMNKNSTLKIFEYIITNCCKNTTNPNAILLEAIFSSMATI